MTPPNKYPQRKPSDDEYIQDGESADIVPESDNRTPSQKGRVVFGGFNFVNSNGEELNTETDKEKIEEELKNYTPKPNLENEDIIYEAESKFEEAQNNYHERANESIYENRTVDNNG